MQQQGRLAMSLKGFVPEGDGQALVPHYLDQTIRELNGLGALSVDILRGDLERVGLSSKLILGSPVKRWARQRHTLYIVFWKTKKRHM